MDGQTDGRTDRFAISISRDSMLTLDKKTKNKIWQKTIFNTADWILTPCNVARSWHWFRQVTALCNVICGSEMTCHWILPVAAPCNVTRSYAIVTLNSPGGSTLQCGRWLWDDMPLNSPKRPPYWNSTSGFVLTTSPQSTCHSAPFCETLSKSDHPRQKKMTSCRFWR